MTSEIKNPYNFQYPIKNSQFFAGRVDEQKIIKDDLLLPLSKLNPHHNIAIIGPRASGKTSLAMIISKQAKDMNILPIYIALDRKLVENEGLFFRELASQLILQGKKHFGLFSGKVDRLKRFFKGLSFEASVPLISSTVKVSKSVSEDERTLLISAIQEDIESILKEAKKKTKAKVKSLLVIIDEAQEFGRNETLLQRFRNIFQLMENVGLVLCGLEDLFNSLSMTFSPIPRFFTKISLGPYRTLAEVIDAIERPLKAVNAQMIIPPTFISRIYKASRALPYDINLICHFSYQVNVDSGVHNLNNEVWNRIFRYVKSYTNEENLAILDELTNNDRIILNTIAYHHSSFTIDEWIQLFQWRKEYLSSDTLTIDPEITNITGLKEIFDKLEKLGIIHKNPKDERYDFKDMWFALFFLLQQAKITEKGPWFMLGRQSYFSEFWNHLTKHRFKREIPAFITVNCLENVIQRVDFEQDRGMTSAGTPDEIDTGIVKATLFLRESFYQILERLKDKSNMDYFVIGQGGLSEKCGSCTYYVSPLCILPKGCPCWIIPKYIFKSKDCINSLIRETISDLGNFPDFKIIIISQYHQKEKRLVFVLIYPNQLNRLKELLSEAKTKLFPNLEYEEFDVHSNLVPTQEVSQKYLKYVLDDNGNCKVGIETEFAEYLRNHSSL
ncbi:MAG: AAA family ATPase [Promethearchaeota archaeon]